MCGWTCPPPRSAIRSPMMTGCRGSLSVFGLWKVMLFAPERAAQPARLFDHCSGWSVGVHYAGYRPQPRSSSDNMPIVLVSSVAIRGNCPTLAKLYVHYLRRASTGEVALVRAPGFTPGAAVGIVLASDPSVH